jgi:hypothetical protein
MATVTNGTQAASDIAHANYSAYLLYEHRLDFEKPTFTNAWGSGGRSGSAVEGAPGVRAREKSPAGQSPPVRCRRAAHLLRGVARYFDSS